MPHMPLNLDNSTHNKSVYVNFMPLRPLRICNNSFEHGFEVAKEFFYVQKKNDPFQNIFFSERKMTTHTNHKGNLEGVH